MTIELDKDALSAAWQAFYDMNSADPSGMEAAIRAYLTAIRQPERDAVVEAAVKWRKARRDSFVSNGDPEWRDKELTATINLDDAIQELGT